ncbi:hypothetical protein [Methylocystis sp. SC2]|uniref:hypothetical protein n=1 Tax=Methylocystis sp. (strain SC2) TaxID=187303 RepID=UPI0005A4FBF2|nr:hypothetical protein [Methylocystis sp. SC2]
MTMLIDAAKNRDELFSSLGGIEVRVPGRADGRTKEHKERSTICRLLSSLAQADELIYPLSAEQTAPPDPDFILNLGSVPIGVEVTEATSDAYSEYLTFAAKRERAFPEKSFALIEPASFRPGAWKRARHQEDRIDAMEAEANKRRLTSEGWSGNEPEHEWANYVIEAAQRKTKRVSAYFSRCQKVWLLVYVNAPLPNIHFEDALSVMIPEVENFWRQDQWFDVLHIVDGSTIISVKPDGCSKMPVHDLWNSKTPLNDLNDAISAESDQALWDKVVRAELRETEFGFEDDEDESSKES